MVRASSKIITSSSCGCYHAAESAYRLEALMRLAHRQLASIIDNDDKQLGFGIYAAWRKAYWKKLCWRRIITLAASSGKRIATVWRPSVCLPRRHTHRDSLGAACDAASVHFGAPITKADVTVSMATIHHWWRCSESETRLMHIFTPQTHNHIRSFFPIEQLPTVFRL